MYNKFRVLCKWNCQINPSNEKTVESLSNDDEWVNLVNIGANLTILFSLYM